MDVVEGSSGRRSVCQDKVRRGGHAAGKDYSIRLSMGCITFSFFACLCPFSCVKHHCQRVTITLLPQALAVPLGKAALQHHQQWGKRAEDSLNSLDC